MNMSLAGGRPLASQAIEPLRKRRVGVSKTKAAIPVSAKKTSIRRKAFGPSIPPCPRSQCWGGPVTEWLGLRKKRPSLRHAFCSTPGNIEIGGAGRLMILAADFADGRFFHRHRYLAQCRFPHLKRISVFCFSLVLDPGRAGPSGVKAKPGGAERGRARRGRAGLGGPGPRGQAGPGPGQAGPSGPSHAGLGRSESPARAAALMDVLHAPRFPI